VEVYRLELLAPEVQLAPQDSVLCRVPAWRFDLTELEKLHEDLKDLRRDHELLQKQYHRTQEALMSLSMSVDAAEASDVQPRGGDGRRELRQKLAHCEKKEQETKATIIALRTDFNKLITMWQGEHTLQMIELPSLMEALWPQGICADMDQTPEPAKALRHASQPVQRPTTAPAGRRLASRQRQPGAYATTGIRPRVGNQRVNHSAGAAVRLTP